MKRTSDYMGQTAGDMNKKPRFTQGSYGDMYPYAGLNNGMSSALLMSSYPSSMGSQFSATSSSQANFPGLGQFASAANGAMYGMSGYGSNPSMNPSMTSSMNQSLNQSLNQSMMANQFSVSNPAYNYSFPPSLTPPDISRTIYLGNVPKEATPADVLNHVKTGTVESFKILPEKNCAFLTFVEPASAQSFYQEHLQRKLSVNTTDLRVGWGKPSSIPTALQAALNLGATRNVYVGNLDSSVTEESLEQDLSKYGQIEHIKLLRDKNIAFVHFTTIACAVKCVNALPSEPQWANRRVNYGKDRCAYANAKAMGAANNSATDAQSSQYAAFGFQNPFQGAFGFDPYTASSMNSSMMSQAYCSPMGSNVTLRTLYVGSILPEVTCEDLCNAIRGGVLYQIRYLQEKHIAFVTFVDAAAAIAVYNHANTTGLVVKGRRVKVGWGKPNSIPSAVVMAVQGGASRNVYVGGIEESVTEEKLREDFSEFGEIELINTLKEKSCAFVNFTSITSAMKALGNIKQNPTYNNYKINYGKDRCGNPPKRPANHGTAAAYATDPNDGAGSAKYEE